MKNNFYITTINDEISDDLNETIEFLKSHKVEFVELRTINKKNLVDYPIEEISKFYNLLQNNGIGVSALASPLFKWYPENTKQESIEKVDNFNFNPELSFESKKFYITKAIETAKTLETKNIRIFSSLRSPSGYYSFEEDPLLQFALREASREGANLLLENEPPCYIYKMDDIKYLANKYYSDGLEIWFDIANFYKIGEQIFLKDLEILKNQIKYIHLKDFDLAGNYVPFGQGIINYKKIISDIRRIFIDKEIFLSIETHVRFDPKQAISESISKLRQLLLEKRIG